MSKKKEQIEDRIQEELSDEQLDEVSGGQPSGATVGGGGGADDGTPTFTEPTSNDEPSTSYSIDWGFPSLNDPRKGLADGDGTTNLDTSKS
jgi:hypothetical protein